MWGVPLRFFPFSSSNYCSQRTGCNKASILLPATGDNAPGIRLGESNALAIPVAALSQTHKDKRPTRTESEGQAAAWLSDGREPSLSNVHQWDTGKMAPAGMGNCLAAVLTVTENLGSDSTGTTRHAFVFEGNPLREVCGQRKTSKGTVSTGRVGSAG